MASFKTNILHPFRFKLFTINQLPLAFVAGLKVVQLTDESSTVSITYNYWTKNPFRSMYFAAQAMAAELSTGVLVMDQVQAAKPKKISMLVYNMEADFTKKATGKILFTCNQGDELNTIMEKVTNSTEGQIITLTSTGRDEENEIVSTFRFTWTLKEKK